MAKIVCVLYEDPATGYPRTYARDGLPDELLELFKDCEPGALPPLGLAYGVDTILDQSLVDAPDIYSEADDHRALVHVSGSGFLKLMANAPRGQISYHA